MISKICTINPIRIMQLESALALKEKENQELKLSNGKLEKLLEKIDRDS